MVCITGGTGHLGNVLIRKLIEKNSMQNEKEKIRVLVFPTDSIDHIKDLDVDIVYGDVRDKNSLIKAFDNCDIVYHLASYISIIPGEKRILESINIKGVENVVDACKICNVKRLVYVSSIHAFQDIPIGQVIDENTPISPELAIGDYGKSKAKATLYVKEKAKDYIDAVIACPTGIIGPYDFKISRMGKFFLDFVNSKIPFNITGEYNFVDVRDVAEALILLSEKGKRGEVYILGGETIKIPKIIEYFSEYSGKRRPKITLPIWILYLIVPFLNLYYLIFKKPGNITLESIKILQSNANISYEKAKKDINYKPRPIKETIKDMVFWFKSYLNMC
ncbi:MAG: NAD-dependent epimerase/dehydratase family protein [Spirochaetes bacterium]|nr:NAD-dependent epimerase/dehydratase family protein [Spirochaetota bacterium]